MVRTHFFDAERDTAAILTKLMVTYWGMDADLASWALAGVMESKFSRPMTFKHHLAVACRLQTDLVPLFGSLATPAFLVAMYDDICTEGLLNRSTVNRIQNHILTVTDRDGAWRALPA